MGKMETKSNLKPLYIVLYERFLNVKRNIYISTQLLFYYELNYKVELGLIRLCRKFGENMYDKHE